MFKSFPGDATTLPPPASTLLQTPTRFKGIVSSFPLELAGSLLMNQVMLATHVSIRNHTTVVQAYKLQAGEGCAALASATALQLRCTPHPCLHWHSSSTFPQRQPIWHSIIHFHRAHCSSQASIVPSSPKTAAAHSSEQCQGRHVYPRGKGFRTRTIRTLGFYYPSLRLRLRCRFRPLHHTYVVFFFLNSNVHWMLLPWICLYS
jgi:hypothetical protein